MREDFYMSNDQPRQRAAIYARCASSDQGQDALGDQLARARGVAATNGWQSIATYQDINCSGMTREGRPGLDALLAAARDKEFEILLVEDISRLSRDTADLMLMFEEFGEADIAIEPVKGTARPLIRNPLGAARVRKKA